MCSTHCWRSELEKLPSFAARPAMGKMPSTGPRTDQWLTDSFLHICPVCFSLILPSTSLQFTERPLHPDTPRTKFFPLLGVPHRTHIPKAAEDWVRCLFRAFFQEPNRHNNDEKRCLLIMDLENAFNQIDRTRFLLEI